MIYIIAYTARQADYVARHLLRIREGYRIITNRMNYETLAGVNADGNTFILVREKRFTPTYQQEFKQQEIIDYLRVALCQSPVFPLWEIIIP